MNYRKLITVGAVVLILAIQGVILYRQQSIISAMTGNDKLNHKLEIYISFTVDVDRDSDNRAVVEQTLQELAESFGGSSAHEIRGCWITKDGTPVFEKNTVCFVYCTSAQLEAGKKQFRELARKLRESLRQESVAIVIDGAMEFI